MNPNFKLIETRSNGFYTTKTVEVSDLSIDWLLRNYGKPTEDASLYLCCFMAYAIEGSLRQGETTSLNYHPSYNLFPVGNDGNVSSANFNYSLMMGLGLSKKAMAGVRAVMQRDFGVHFEKGSEAPQSGSDSFGITTLIRFLRFTGSEVVSAEISPLYDAMLEFLVHRDSPKLCRKLILKKIKEKHPNFIFPTLTFTYTARNES
jgi:hypothetical protein